MDDVSRIIQTEAVQPDRDDKGGFGRKKQKKRQAHRRARKHFEELSKLVDETHRELENANSPFRLCVYQEGEDIYIDIMTIDPSGDPTRVFRHDISQVAVEELVAQIKSGTGLLLNADA